MNFHCQNKNIILVGIRFVFQVIMSSKIKVSSESEFRRNDFDFDLESSIHMDTVLLTAEEIKVRNQVHSKIIDEFVLIIFLINISSTGP